MQSQGDYNLAKNQRRQALKGGALDVPRGMTCETQKTYGEVAKAAKSPYVHVHDDRDGRAVSHTLLQ